MEEPMEINSEDIVKLVDNVFEHATGQAGAVVVLLIIGFAMYNVFDKHIFVYAKTWMQDQKDLHKELRDDHKHSKQVFSDVADKIASKVEVVGNNIATQTSEIKELTEEVADLRDDLQNFIEEEERRND
jgi:cell division protein FtsB